MQKSIGIGGALLLLLVTGAMAQRVVDSRELGLLRVEMTMFEVQERLGPPTDIQYGSVLVSSAGATLLLDATPKAIWFYRGTSVVPAAEIVIVNGRVQIVRRVGEGPR